MELRERLATSARMKAAQRSTLNGVSGNFISVDTKELRGSAVNIALDPSILKPT